MTHIATPTIAVGQYRTPRGNAIQLHYRLGTNDAALISAILSTDEYGLANVRPTGWALDVGAHVGSVGLALAIDNPDLKVVMVEPVPSNADLIRRSIEANGLGHRVFLEEAGAGKLGDATVPCTFGYSRADGYDDHYVNDTRFVGNVIRDFSNPDGERIDVPVVTLATLAAAYGPFSFCKIDCEGCEWNFLASDAEQIEVIVGEWHDLEFTDIAALLDATHEVELIDDKGGIGLFRAVRR